MGCAMIGTSALMHAQIHENLMERGIHIISVDDIQKQEQERILKQQDIKTTINNLLNLEPKNIELEPFDKIELQTKNGVIPKSYFSKRRK